MAELRVVGKSVPRVDALEKVTGRAPFAIDYNPPHMLHGKLVRSPYPHARISRIDTSEAEKMPGVKAVVTPENTSPLSLPYMLTDRYAFPIDGKVRSVGEPVAAVAAETEAIAEEAADRVNVEYEELPAVFDVEEAFGTDPPTVIHPDLPNYKCVMGPPITNWRLVPERPNVFQYYKVRKGDVEKAFEEADLIVENRYYMPRLHHCFIEPLVCVAWVESDGTLVLRGATHGVWITKRIICEAFNLPVSKVRVQSPYIGGSFGGKGRSLAEVYAPLLSFKANGRPVRVCYTREEVFQAGRSRPPIVCYLKDGVKKDGTIIARESKIILDAGAYADQAFVIVKNCTFGQTGTYRIPNFKLDTYGVYTNTPMSGPFRGFGNTQTQWAAESQMNLIAEKLGIDPVELRKKHFLKEGERDANGQVTHSIGVKECLDKATEWIKSADKPKAEGPWKTGRGVAVCNKYTIIGSSSSAVVKVHADGVVEVRHSSDEVGMGVNTVVAQIAAEEFKMAVDLVKVVSGDTDLVPYGWPPVSSRETFHMGNALIIACRDAKRQILEIAAPRLNVPINQLEIRDRKVYQKGDPREKLAIPQLFSPPGMGFALGKGEITGNGLYVGPGVPEDPETGQSERMVISRGYGACAVDVKVNVETGEVKILRVSAAFDGGQAINPKMIEGQIESGLVMGIGTALFEEMVMDKGTVVNRNFMDYKIPTSMDLPGRENIAIMLAGVPHREGPFGAKGIGEAAAIPFPPAISQALYDATGVRINDLPLSREKILMHLKEG